MLENTILTDLKQQNWRIGKAIGKGSFGEIFLASNEIKAPVTKDNANYVVKIEPHSNGPLFVEIHCLLNTAKSTDPLPLGMTEYIASGSHILNGTKYRFLVLRRYKCDLHSIIKNRRVDPKCVLIIASQILEILKHFHDKGYTHSDIKAENLMIGSCKLQNFNRNNDNDMIMGEYDDDEEEDEDYEDDDDEIHTILDDSYMDNDYSNDTNFKTPTNIIKRRCDVDYSGSNPIRSCRLKSTRLNSTYQDMLRTHYLRPSKSVNYFEKDSFESKDSIRDNDFIPTSSKFSTDKKYDKRDDVILLDTPIKKNDVSVNDVTEDRIFLIDFGLASKFVDQNGLHRPFCMDQRRAHDGTLEFTSRDAHMGAHSRRSDLECLGYNLIFWCQGTLPWKDEKLLAQPEHVHRMKEYFMTDVTFMLKQIYGKSVPSFLGEFMNYVCKLTYEERPDYDYCKLIFEREFLNMGYQKTEMNLNIDDLKTKVKDIKHELENTVSKIKNYKSIMKLGFLLPFKETISNSNKISPKNLRSKTEKLPKKQRKKISWTENFIADPDKISRQRAEKEYERAQVNLTPLRYTGNPTYAILEMENKIKFRDKLDLKEDEPVVILKGYNKAMMDVLKKRQMYLMSQFEKKTKETHPSDDDKKNNRRHGLRPKITPTRKSLSYRSDLKNRFEKKKNKRISKNISGDLDDNDSCSSNTDERSFKSLDSSIYEENTDTIDDYVSPIKKKNTRKNLIINKPQNIIRGRVEKRVLHKRRNKDISNKLRTLSRG